MAVVAPSSSETLDPKPDQSSIEQTQILNQDTSNSTPSSIPPPTSSSLPLVTAAPDNTVPTSNPAIMVPPPPPAPPSFTPSFRPIVSAPQFSPVVNPNIQNPSFQVQNPNLQPPGVSIGGISGAGMVSVTAPPGMQPVGYFSATGQVPGVQPRPYWQAPPNGYMGIQPSAPHGQGFMHPPGIHRYPGPYSQMVRPGFVPRPSVPVGVILPLSRPLIPGSGAPAIPQVIRPGVPIVAPTEKPQTTVYVGKIASTVENDYLLSILRLCGPVKSWKRAQDPSDGTPRGFGFCEFQSAEGVLRALRLLTKFNIDGQELVLNVNQATRQYLERYVEKKRESVSHKETEGDVSNGVSGASGIEKQGSVEVNESSKIDTDSTVDKEKEDNTQEFGIITDEDRDFDRDALEKLKIMIEERLKAKPLPLPPPLPTTADSAQKSNNELPSRSREKDSDIDILRNGVDRTEDDISSEFTPNIEHDKSDRSRKRERSREIDRERDMKREKERELERQEREKERERVRRERERDLKIRDAERRYKDRVKEWEAREREKDYQRQYEREREKERENKRRREIIDQEDQSDDEDIRSRRHRSSVFAENRRKMYREKEEDNDDRMMEEIEISEAKKRASDEQKKKDELQAISEAVNDGNDLNGTAEDMFNIDEEDNAKTLNKISDSLAGDESIMESISISEAKHGNNISSRKLGFGLIGSGKRTSVPSVFHEEDDEDMDKDKKMRPLVPIDYSTEELQAVHANMSGTSSNLVAAAEFAKRLSGSNKKEEKTESERDRSRRNNERQRDRGDNESKHSRNESRDRLHDKSHDRDDKPRTSENKKLLDAKQLIDMIPKTKEELFSYEINWLVYDKHNLHERMRPWISKKITEFLGEEEVTFVDYIVSSTKDHVKAPEMLQLLQPILDEEAEMFVLKMWRMLIFEIKKVETGLSMKSKA